MSTTQHRIFTSHICVQIKLSCKTHRISLYTSESDPVIPVRGCAVNSLTICDYVFLYNMTTWYGDIMENMDLVSVLNFWLKGWRMLRFRTSTLTCNSLPFKAWREWGSAPPPDLPFFPGHVLTLLGFIFARMSQSPAQTYWMLSWEPSRPCCVCLLLDSQIRLSLISMTAWP